MARSSVIGPDFLNGPVPCTAASAMSAETMANSTKPPSTDCKALTGSVAVCARPITPSTPQGPSLSHWREPGGLLIALAIWPARS